MSKGKLTSAQRQQICAEYQAGKGSERLAQDFKVSGQSILKLLKKAGIPIRPRKFVSAAQSKQIAELYEKSGWTMQQIADELKISSVFQHLKKQGVKSRTPEEAHRKFPMCEDFFDTIDCEEKAYFLGFLYADGCNQMEHFYAAILALEVSDKEVLDKLARLIYFDEATAQHMIKISNRIHEGKGIEARLNMCSKHMCLKLNDLGCVPHKTFKLVYPDWLQPGLHRHLIRGYFDGDGTINNVDKKQVGCKIISTKQFLEGVQTIVTKFGIATNLYKDDPNNDKNTWVLCVNGNRNIQKFLNWIYDGSTIYLNRKYESFLAFKEKMKHSDELSLEGTRGFPKRYVYENYPDFYEPIVVNNTLLTRENLNQMSIEEKEFMAHDVLDYFRSRGFKFLTNKPLKEDYQRLVGFNHDTNNPEIPSNNICTSLCKYYCQDYFATKLNGSISIVDAFADDKALYKVIRNRMGITRDEVYNTSYSNIVSGFHSSGECYNISIFKPVVAKYMYLKYSNPEETVYDFSAGWGGRMLGAASCGRKYIGVDPLTTGSLGRLAGDLGLSNITLVDAGSESVKLEENSVDFAFSSPPYYDLEIYSKDGSQSYNNGEDYFYNVYWRGTLKNIKHMLKSGKYLALNISNVPRMLDIAKEYFGEVVEENRFSMPRIHLNRKSDNDKIKSENIYVFRNSK